MKKLFLRCVAIFAMAVGVMTAAAPAPVSAVETLLIEDFSAPIAAQGWIVGVPNENIKVEVADQELRLHYKFTGDGQYLGINIPVKVKAPISAVKFRVKGDKSNTGYALYLQDASGETHKFPTGKKIDWDGWQDVEIDVSGGHEIWGGDDNKKIDYPLKFIVIELGTPGAVESDLAFADLKVDTSLTETEMFGVEIKIIEPAYCADVTGDTKVTFKALGLKTLKVSAWGEGGDAKYGKEIVIADAVAVAADGSGEFIFPADKFPRGPVTITLYGKEGKNIDYCYLQVFNKSGKPFATGIPATEPPAAKGLKLVFADDFTDAELSIGDGAQFKYYDHKPNNGQTDFSDWGVAPFVSNDKPNTPFAAVDGYLRIRCDANKKSTGIISTMGNNGVGLKVPAPCYFECRMIGPNAIGSWPAVWLMTDHQSPESIEKHKGASDELDIIEAYGGNGPSHPNGDYSVFDAYQITPHRWAQGDEGNKDAEAAYRMMNPPARMNKKGIPSSWFEAFHTYGCLVTETDTIYYCDDIEMGRHPTFPLSKEVPIFLMVNLAVGGGWPIDLSRYNNTIDMYVDYIRVYGAK